MYLEIWLSVYLYLYDNVHTLLQLFFCVTKYKMEEAGNTNIQDDSNGNGDSSDGERVSEEHTETDNNQDSESDFTEETDPSTNLSNVLVEVDMLSDGVSDDNVDSENLEALNSSADEKGPLPFHPNFCQARRPRRMFCPSLLRVLWTLTLDDFALGWYQVCHFRVDKKAFLNSMILWKRHYLSGEFSEKLSLAEVWMPTAVPEVHCFWQKDNF